MAIIFVDSTPTGGDDGTTWEHAYVYLNNPLSVANHAPGDQYLVSGTFNETVTLAEVATRAATTHIQGDDKSGGAGVGVAAQFTIDGEATRANCIDSALATAVWYVFKNMTLTGASSHGGGLSAEDNMIFMACKFNSNSGSGINCDNVTTFEECEASDNSTHGIDSDGGAVVGCMMHRNGSNGFNGVGGVLLFNECFSNAGTAIYLNSSGTQYIFNNTIDGDADDTTNGIHQDHASTQRMVVINNIIYDCATGFRADGDGGETWLSRNNLVNANATAYVNAATFTGEVTSAPSFTDEGSQDYKLSSSSAAKAAGFDAGDVVNGASFMDIGAHQREESGAEGTFPVSQPMGYPVTPNMVPYG